MGLFDSLLRAGVRAVTSKAVDAAVDAVFDSIKGENNSGSSTTTITHSEEDNRSFDEKLNVILQSAGNYEVRRNISPDELEQEAGKEIYTRATGWCLPSELTYAIYKDGQRVLYINLWDDYKYYARKANGQIRDYLAKQHIKMIDFFDYMPNEFAYMEERIKRELA